MFKISLINMPSAALNMPSIALTQLKAVVKARLGARVTTDIHYINQDFARYIGLDLYQNIVHSGEHFNSGIGDWFFRHAAFPDQPDNTDEYLRRCYAYPEEQRQMFSWLIADKRRTLDAFLDDLVTKYALDQASIVGFTSMFTQNVASIALARKIRARNPAVVTVMGGANCEAPMGFEIARHVDVIDWVFSGPALKSFPEFVQHCLDQDLERCARIPGVLGKTNGTARTRFAMAGDAGPVMPMGEELPIDVPVELDYDSFLDDINTAFPQVVPLLLFETSRGCWWGERAHCTFCGLNGSTMTYRAMSPSRAIDYVTSLFRYADRCLTLNAVDNIMPRAYPVDVLPYLSTPQNVCIFYEVKADLTEADVQALARAGVRAIQPGIEALSTSTLKLMKKGTSVFQNLTLLKYCATYGIYPTWYLLLGFPGEDESVFEKYFRDIPSLAHLPPPGGVFEVRFDRYSPYFNQADKYGLDLKPFDFYELTYPFDADSLKRLAYYFVDRHTDAPYRLATNKWTERLAEQTGTWRSRWRDQCQSLRPKLQFEGTGPSARIIDSRSGTSIERAVSEAGLDILHHLARPRKIAEVAAEMRHVAGADVAAEIAALFDAGLVFEEGGRFMNLVCNSTADCREDHVTPDKAVAEADMLKVARCEW